MTMYENDDMLLHQNSINSKLEAKQLVYLKTFDAQEKP